MEVTEPVRVWVAEALTGNIVGELRLAGESSWASRFGGGAFQASVSVGHLRSRTGGTLDWAAIQQVLEWCTGGKYSLVLTLGTTCLGEWLLMTRKEGTTADGVLPIGGIEWDGYPAFRYLEKHYRNPAHPRRQLAATLLEDCFRIGQATMQITIPASVGVGSSTAIDHLRGDAYYSDVLEEITDTDDGLDWRVVQTLTWSGGAPTKVNRAVEFAAPVMARATNITVEYEGPGFRTGNTLDVGRGFDFARSAAKVFGAAAGQGDDQITWEETWDGLTGLGFVQTSTILSAPGVKSDAELGKRVRAERDAAMNVHDPLTTRVLLEKLAAYPRVGDSVKVDLGATYSLPYGFDATMRLGETKLSLDGNWATTIDIDGV